MTDATKTNDELTSLNPGKAICVVSEEPLSLERAMAMVDSPADGASCSFVGKVRNRNHGRDVTGVSYDIYQALAENMFKEICAKAQEQWGSDLNLYVAHRQGHCAVGDISVVIVADSVHRDEAFLACRYVIEQVKHKAPIWKQEHYVDGDSEWSKGCTLCRSSAKPAG